MNFGKDFVFFLVFEICCSISFLEEGDYGFKSGNLFIGIKNFLGFFRDGFRVLGF